jgi:hypothetical protein
MVLAQIITEFLANHMDFAGNIHSHYHLWLFY